MSWLGRRKGIPKLSERVAVVTGAANGIGRALALGLREKGCHLALVDRDRDGLARLQLELHAIPNQEAITAHVADVADRSRMEAAANEVADAHGAVHLLINSAGVAHEAPFQQISLDDWDHVLNANFWGVVLSCRCFLPYLAKADRAHIVNLSSLLGIVGMPGQSAYCATKFAVRGFSEALSEELRTTSVGMTVVYPGAVDTGIMRRGRGDDPEFLQRIDRWYQQHAIPPAKAASRIIRAIERGTPRLLITSEAKFGDYLRRLMPVTGNRLMAEAAIRSFQAEDMRTKRQKQWRETMERRGPK
jgi:NAD(P)-dependent dehydrogenase (short-subunit alcohol dehydrogenase family)